MATKKTHKRAARAWRTNLGLRLDSDVAEFFQQICKKENRTYANYIETLIKKDMQERPLGVDTR